MCTISLFSALPVQVTRGGNPNWLARDQEELENYRQNAFENRLDELDQELEEIGEDANQRRNHPQRQEFDRQTTHLKERIEQEVENFQRISQQVHTKNINDLWLQEMEILHKLNTNNTRFDLAVRSAQERLERHQQSGLSLQEASEVSVDKLWYSSEGSLDQVDLRLIDIVSRPPPKLHPGEEKDLEERLVQVRKDMDVAKEVQKQYIDRALAITDVTSDENDEELPITDFHPEEQVRKCTWDMLRWYTGISVFDLHSLNGCI